MVSLPHRDPLPVSPLQQRDEVLPADAQPLANICRLNGALTAEIVEDPGELLQGFTGIVPVALHCLNPAACRRQPEERLQIPMPG